jgi:hypothetical protein
MVEMRMGEQQHIHLRWVEPERRVVLLAEGTRTLIQAAVNGDAPARALDEMTRAGDGAVGTVKGNIHDWSCPFDRVERMRARSRSLKLRVHGAAYVWECYRRFELNAELAWAESVIA